MRKRLILGTATLAALAACSGDSLNIVNTNDPDVARIYATPAGVEGVVAGLYLQIFNPSRATESVNTQARILSGEGFASVANFGMAARAQIPRSVISNELGNDNATGNVRNFNSFSLVSRTAANAIAALDRFSKLASPISTGSVAQDARAKAFAYFALGTSLGYLSLGHDSAAIVTAATPIDVTPPLSSAADVNKSALAALDSALAIANSPAATTGINGFPLPSTWINGATVDRAQFIRIVRSYKARLRAGLARNPAQRAAVDWPAVIADATNGITADFTVNVGGGSGWSAAYDTEQMYVTGGWHALPYFYYGMADVSGGYDAWLATPRDSRRAFLVITPDKRWPQGATRATQQAEAPALILPAGRYIRNRPTGEDVPLTGPGDSQYDHRRYGAVRTASNTGPYTEMSVTEVDMLAAEGHFRTGNIPAAAALIDKSRVRNGLSSVAGVTSATAPISTDLASCVPRVPVGPAFTMTACGNIFEALKYEKRMETAYTGYMIWFTDSRGWGDLVEGTPVEWPVPYQEMQARSTPFYNGTNRAGKGTYGF